LIGQLLPLRLSGQRDQSLAGRKLYSPLTLLAFAVLANPLFASTLLALNLRRRGSRAAGSMLLVVSLLALALMVAYGFVATEPQDFRLLALAGGLFIFGAERHAFAAAVLAGASRARWWPPALVLVALVAAVVAVELTLTP
jgi:hypothetical protein